VQGRSPSNLTELERVCREEWEKLPKYRCAKLVASYPIKLLAVIAPKGASNKVLSRRSEYICKCDMSGGFYLHICKNVYKPVFALSICGIVCRLRGK
jgi:hypothetical protein